MFGTVNRIAKLYSNKILYKRFNSTVANISQSAKRAFIFRSTTTNPYINLSIEHHLFQSAPAGSRILFFYVNDPCVIIGRNQNPWVEVNLLALSRGINSDGDSTPIDFVRRRSGGGTVWHDAGNVNWSVICDLNEFTRDRHVEMVTRGLRRLGVGRARVNERHDVVLDQGDLEELVDESDLHVSPYMSGEKTPLKVSGSAYKIARNRALHHGTALLDSKHLGRIGEMLRAPAREFINAKGVESVRSPVANLGVSREDFEEKVEEEFSAMYHIDREDVQAVDAGDECLEIEAVRKGVEELQVSSQAILNVFMILNVCTVRRLEISPNTTVRIFISFKLN
jgi:lipoate-protein ligase A